ncbi:MAG: DUF3623 family protein [Pseudomonadota bacterium]
MTAALLFALTLWWGATQALLWGARLAPAWVLNLVALGCALIALGGAHHTASMTGTVAAYAGISAGLCLWAAVEMVFLTGAVLGFHRPARLDTLAERATSAFCAIAFHEAVLLVALASLALLQWGSLNPAALSVFALLYIMRASAKLNLFLGVRNLCIEFLPPRVRHLAHHFRRAPTERPINPLFPFSVIGGSLATAFLLRQGLDPEAGVTLATTSLVCAVLAALGTLEHWLMVTPLSPQALWSVEPTSSVASRHLERIQKAYN